MRKSILLGGVLLICALAASAQTQQFTPVEGSDLRSRLDAAIKLGGGQQTRYWTAYSFEVRPGVAVDFESINDDGSTIHIQGTSVIALGSTVETRNLGVFLLHPSGGGPVARIEVYNLDRRHEYSGYPVYWLGRARNEESLNLLRGLVEADQARGVAERALFAIALHDDEARVGPILENFVRSSALESVRAKAVFWLTQVPGGAGRQGLFTELARNERESIEVRKQAVSALGHSREAGAFAILQNLYQSVSNRELKRRILSAISDHENSDTAVNFLIKIANSEPDLELRKKALQHLGQKAGQRGLTALTETVDKSDAETEVQKQAVVAISRRPKDESVPLLIKIARTHPKAEVRRQAISLLARSGDERALEFFKEILAK